MKLVRHDFWLLEQFVKRHPKAAKKSRILKKWMRRIEENRIPEEFKFATIGMVLGEESIKELGRHAGFSRRVNVLPSV